MSLVEKLFSNPAIKNLAFGTLKTTFKEHGFKLGTFRLDDAGDIDVQTYTDPVTVVKTAELDELRRVYAAWLMGMTAPEL